MDILIGSFMAFFPVASIFIERYLHFIIWIYKLFVYRKLSKI